MLLGVHVIVRDEADVLGRCLSSVQGIADEIIVADTGSTDQSAAIAAGFGAKVIEVPWKDDFAAVRNRLLEEASTQWIFVLDADEWLTGGELSLLRQELENADESVSAFHIQMEHVIDDTDHQNVVRSDAVRLFRNGHGFKYTGEIHEQLCTETNETKEAEGPLLNASFLLLHDGYKPSVLQRKKKTERNLRIITRQLTQQPNDPFCLYNYAVALCQSGRLEEALDAFRQSLATTSVKAPYRPTLIRDYAKTLLASGKADEAGQLLRGETLGYSDYAELHLLYGESLVALHLLTDAEAAFKAAIAAGEKNYVSLAGSSTYRANTALAEIYLRLGHRIEAHHHLKIALEQAPQWEPALKAMALWLHEDGVPDSALADRLGEWMEPGQTKLVARVLGGIGAYGEALLAWQSVQNEELTVRDTVLFSECLIGNQRYSEASELLKDLVVHNPSYSEELGIAVVDWMLCLWAEERRMPAQGWSQLRLFMGKHQLEWAKELDLLLTSNRRGYPAALANARNLEAARIFMDRAIGHGMLPLAQRFAKRLRGLDGSLEISLYDNGYMVASAELMLQSYGAKGRLGAEQAYRLGELLYRKRLFQEALPLMEQAVEAEGSAIADRAQLAIASLYLQLALESLQPEEYGGSRSWDGGWPEQDRERITEALRLTEALGWLTNWNGLQRRRAGGDASEANFLMHDR
ncbi:glycosyltransferase family 2 protein [Paenibacillus gorillae]|uniref:glycosyltransferase family 2 protein n=1 Tax=Paenibacillus gorillae TaxID=1243662 RepID=UPI0004B92026|nr:glycosyltransferase family 2 protein [Paenibacillus gorillae]